MKKRWMNQLITTLLVGAMAVSVVACGETENSTTAETPASDAAPAAIPPEPEEEKVSDEGFKVTDVSADMIETGVYYINEKSGQGIVMALFQSPAENKMCTIATYNEKKQKSDVAWGYYNEASTEKDKKGVSWTYVAFDDLYTAQSMKMGFGDKGKTCYMLTPDGKTYKARYLTAEETAAYLKTAVAFSTAAAESDE